MISLIEKGIKVTNLFESDVFCHQFELEDWPIIHHNDSAYIVPYNGSKFDLEGKYHQVFKKLAKQDKEELHDSKKKFFKIKYTLNVLPACTWDGDLSYGVSDLLTMLGDS